MYLVTHVLGMINHSWKIVCHLIVILNCLSRVYCVYCLLANCKETELNKIKSNRDDWLCLACDITNFSISRVWISRSLENQKSYVTVIIKYFFSTLMYNVKIIEIADFWIVFTTWSTIGLTNVKHSFNASTGVRRLSKAW